MANAIDSGIADLYSSPSRHWQSVRQDQFTPVRDSFAEMVSNSPAASRTLYRYGPAPGAFPQPNRVLTPPSFQTVESISRAAHILRYEEIRPIRAMALETKTPFPSTKPFVSQALSAFELLFGAFVVIGHNVFHIVPNEVIVLCVLGLLSLRLRDGGWSAMGFTRPASRRGIVLIALAAAGVRILLGQFVIEPLTGFFWPAPAAPALANEVTGNAKVALLALLLVWTFAAFGEEIAYRGYLLTRAADIGMRSTTA